jgi:hypothetical protein
LRDRFNVILSENASPARTEGSEYVTLKLPQRDSSQPSHEARAGQATDARNDEASFAHLKRFPRFPHVARAIFESGELLQKGQGNFADRSVALFGNDQFRFALLLRARLLVLLINFRAHKQSNQISILLNRSGFAQIAQPRFPSGTRFGLPI